MTDPFGPGGPEQETPPLTDVPNKDARLWATLAHLGGFIFCIPPLVPLIIWLVKKEEHPFIDDQGKEAVNFQIWVLIASFVAWIVAILTCIGTLLSFAVLVANVVFMIMAAIQANSGVAYRYPIPYPRFVK